MSREIFADTGYILGINSFLFAILVNHIDEEKIKINFDDFERKRRQFWNCGVPCYFNFSKEELSYALDNLYKPFIYSIGKEKWAVDIKKIIGNFIDTLKKDNLEYFGYEETRAKIFCLFMWFKISFHIFDHRREHIPSLLKCKWMLNPKESIKHNEFLFNMAKKIKPDGTNTEWFEIKEELYKIECEEFKIINEEGKSHTRSDEEIEKLFEEKLSLIKGEVLSRKK